MLTTQSLSSEAKSVYTVRSAIAGARLVVVPPLAELSPSLTPFPHAEMSHKLATGAINVFI